MYELYELPVSIDLETAGLSPDAPILSIGAVRFVKNPTEMLLHPAERHEFSVTIDLKGQTAIDSSTFYWWLRQSDEAREAVAQSEGGLSLSNALRALWQWLQADAFVAGSQSNFTGELWIRGDRDSCWLEEAHKRCGIKPGYKFGMVRDQRTMVAFAEARGVVMPHRSGVAHDALEDARYQAECLQAIFQRWPEVY